MMNDPNVKDTPFIVESDSNTGEAEVLSLSSDDSADELCNIKQIKRWAKYCSSYIRDRN